MSKRPWMPLYIGNYLTKTAHLSAAQSGAYLHLLMHAWSNAGALPLHDQALARIAKMADHEWLQSKDIIVSFFTVTPEGLRNNRLDEELEIADKLSESSTKKARNAAYKRWQNNASSNSSSNASSTPQAMPHDAPSLSHSQVREEVSKEEARADARRSPKGTRLPKDWWPNEANIQYALAKGLTLERVNLEAEKFRNYWTAKTKDATKLDWDATWQNWILRAMETNGHGKTRQTLSDLAHDLADDARELEREAGVRRAADPIGRH